MIWLFINITRAFSLKIGVGNARDFIILFIVNSLLNCNKHLGSQLTKQVTTTKHRKEEKLKQRKTKKKNWT